MRYKENGDIDPIRLTPIGVGQYDANIGIEATDYFRAVNAEVRETFDGHFQVRNLTDGSYLVYPKIRNLRQRPTISIRASSIHSHGVEIDIRRRDPAGARLAKLVLKGQTAGLGESTHSVTLHGARDTDDLCLVFKGGPSELISLHDLEFSERIFQI